MKQVGKTSFLQESAFYFCVVTSDSFQTTSDGAYMDVAFLEDMAENSGPVSTEYDSPILLVELQCQVGF